MTRSSLLEVLDREYIKAAKAKGVHETALVYKHAMRNAMIPIVTVIGLQFGELLGGAVLTETVFSIPGMGRLIINSILNREYHVVQAAVLVGVIFFVGVNLIVDVLYGVLNPKIRLEA
jgi:dipeptide transport system permease protein